jgi:membrane protease YdiL (CAAX protease family)
MSTQLPPPTPARRVMRLLWQTARRRAAGRELRQRELMGRRRKEGADSGLGGLMRFFMVLIVCFIHGILGWNMIQATRDAVTSSNPEAVGHIILSSEDQAVLNDAMARQTDLNQRKQALAASTHTTMADRQEVIEAEKRRDYALSQLANRSQPPGKSDSKARQAHRAEVERRFRSEGSAAFVVVDRSLGNLFAQSSRQAAVPTAVLGLFLGWWLTMLVCQGEGLELDVQRRRHPMWEWLLSHPIRPVHAFYTELLAPCMANPIYFTAPIFFWSAFRLLPFNGPVWPAALLVGLPLAVATSAVGKSLETVALLRLGVRTRGAVLGLVSWFGYIAMILPFFLLQFDGFGRLLGGLLGSVSGWFPVWPVRALLFGWGDAPSLTQVTVSWWLFSSAMALGAIGLTQRATVHGLQAPTSGTGPASSRLLAVRSRFGKNPLQRKELLWLWRDKGAIVQVLLVPLTIAATQAFHFRNLYRLADNSWSLLSGVAIICGTYLLLVLGPRSLASEGGALWLSLTWPRGLEDLLKAKARLWSRIANGVVGCILAVSCLFFPADLWKIALVGAGWLIFSRTLALKAVALVSAPSSSGEAEPPNRARYWIALIGTLAFGTGVMLHAWHVAIMGIVFSSLVAVAMWQGLRARLPYLFDPWSEKSVPAPSLLHATVGIALMVEGVGIAVALASAFGNPSTLWLVRSVVYGVVGSIACIVMLGFLKERNVDFGDIVRWPVDGVRFPMRRGLVLAVMLGGATAVLAIVYMLGLRLIPAANEALDEAARFATQYAGQKFWFALLAVGMAPLTEEYFFRGLLYRSLDRELGDWRAMVLSAAFFAIFHSPLAWVPVAALGVVNAWLFKKTRHLLPCVICHATYNAVVIFLPG